MDENVLRFFEQCTLAITLENDKITLECKQFEWWVSKQISTDLLKSILLINRNHSHSYRHQWQSF